MFLNCIRVESIFRLLLHEDSLSKGYSPVMKLQHSIEYHKRDLATILETAKWQVSSKEVCLFFSHSIYFVLFFCGLTDLPFTISWKILKER